MLTNDMDGGQDRTARDWQGIGGGAHPCSSGVREGHSEEVRPDV